MNHLEMPLAHPHIVAYDMNGRIDTMPHVLIVCTANICRSPVAEGMLRRRLTQGDLDGWTVASAGTWAMQERGAAQNSILVSAERGIDISEHRARMVTKEMLAQADLVLCMESGHVEALQAEFPDQAAKIHLLSQMAEKKLDVADPYGAPLENYEQMAQEVETLIEKGLPRIVEMARENARKRRETS